MPAELVYYRTQGTRTFAVAKYPFGIPPYVREKEQIIASFELTPEQEVLELGKLTELFPCPEQKNET